MKDSLSIDSMAGLVDWDIAFLPDRCRMLTNLMMKLCENKSDLAYTLSDEIGKPLPEAIGEVQKCITHIEVTVELAKSALQTSSIPDPSAPKTSALMKRYRPLGTIIVVTPWNFPLWLSFKTIVGAILAGNKVIHRPSGAARKTSLLLQKLISMSILPSSVWRVDTEMSYEAVEDAIKNRVNGVSFCGSTEVGRRIAGMAGAALKPCVLELGGSDLLVVSKGYSDYYSAAQVALKGRLLNNGQVCVATKRAILPHVVGLEKFKADLIEELTNQIYICDTEMKSVDGEVVTVYTLPPPEGGLPPPALALSRLVNASHFMDQVGLLKALLEEEPDVEIIYGDKAWLDTATGEKGNLHFPVFIISNVPVSSRFWNEVEFMCPVLLLGKPSEYDEAILNQSKNDVHWGLGGTLMLCEKECHQFLKDGDKNDEPLFGLRSGMISVNQPVASHSLIPFGGVGASGMGKECGVEGIRSFTYLQTVQVPRPSGEKASWHMPSVPMPQAPTKQLQTAGKTTARLGGALTKGIGGAIGGAGKAARNFIPTGEAPPKKGGVAPSSEDSRAVSFEHVDLS